MKTILVYLLAVFLVTDCLSQSHLKKVDYDFFNNYHSELSVDTIVLTQIVNRKMCELLKYIKPFDWQLSELYYNCWVRQESMDSALVEKKGSHAFGLSVYKIDSIYDVNLYKILTDSQIVAYISNKGRVDVNIKTDEKMRYLEDAGIYKPEELKEMQRQIFNYLMREKIVYMRDRYDIDKQKKNIQSLKSI